MALTPKKLADNLHRVRDNIAAACQRARRDVADVRLVAVVKSADLDDIKNLIELGQVDLGEGRVQQFADRFEEVAAWLSRRRKETPPVRWHMIGHLQRNKVKPVLQIASLIHSVDSLRLAEEIDLRAGQRGAPADVLLEVNCSEESQKFGVAVGAVMHLAEQVSTLRNIRLLGLMGMAPVVSDPEQARAVFVRLREIFEEIRTERLGGKDFGQLSMGMSQDYAVAVEEGATLVRVGTALFGP